MHNKCLLLFAVAFIPLVLVAQVKCTYPVAEPFVPATEIRTVQAGFLSVAPTIDGLPDEAVWQEASEIGGFVWLRRLGNAKLQSFANQQITESRQIPVTQSTTVRVGYDRENLYFAFDCQEERMNELRANEPDQSKYVWVDDCVEIMLQPPSCAETVYWHIILTAGNATSISLNQRNARSFPPVEITRAVHLGAKGWAAEVKIPFISLGETMPVSGTTWRANFGREEQPFQEISSWSEFVVGFLEPESFGRLYFGNSNVPEISSVDWDDPAPGDNRLRAELFNPADKPQAIELELRLGDAVLARQEVILSAQDYTSAELDYHLERAEGILELSCGGESRRLPLVAKTLEGRLETAELLNPVEAIAGQLTVPVGNRAYGKVRLLWSLGEIELGVTENLGGRQVNFEISPPELPIGENCLSVTMQGDGLPEETLELPFNILPGLFDEL